MPIVKATRFDWIGAGLEAYGRGGRDALVVERLAAALGVAKAGFYWHFSDRDAFVSELIDAWQAETTDRLAIDAPFEILAREVFSSRRHLDVEWQLRREADHDLELVARLARIDERRMAHIATTLDREGVPAAARLAAILYDQFLGWASRHRTPTPVQLRRQLARTLDLVDRWRSVG
jgi:AcrR family transcriptional regulator